MTATLVRSPQPWRQARPQQVVSLGNISPWGDPFSSKITIINKRQPPLPMRSSLVVDRIPVPGSPGCPPHIAPSKIEIHQRRLPTIKTPGHPAPARIKGNIHPVPIVVRQPTPGFIANPYQAVEGILSPTPSLIGNPLRLLMGPPNPAIGGYITPLSVTIQITAARMTRGGP